METVWNVSHLAVLTTNRNSPFCHMVRNAPIRRKSRHP